MIKNLSVTSEFKNINKLSVHKLINSLKSELGFKITDLTINFISSENITILNKKHLKHSYSTDIITFNYSGSNQYLDGELFISVEDAARNAIKYKVSLNNELVRLVIHGLLHLLGYNDKKLNEKKIMKSVENQLTYKNIFALLYVS